MLDLPINLRRFYRPVSAVILLSSLALSPLHGHEYHDGQRSIPQHFEQEWINRYFNSIDEETDVEEVVDFLISTRESLVAKGYACPSLSELCMRVRSALIERGIEMDDEVVQEIYEEIGRRENQIGPFFQQSYLKIDNKYKIELIKHKHKNKKDKKELKMKSKGVFGFLKCLAGGLICIIPVPAVQAVGAGLILNGINDIVDDARETGDENERLQKMDEQRRREAQQGIGN